MQYLQCGVFRLEAKLCRKIDSANYIQNSMICFTFETKKQYLKRDLYTFRRYANTEI
jgi:hypothetical protein